MKEAKLKDTCVWRTINLDIGLSLYKDHFVEIPKKQEFLLDNLPSEFVVVIDKAQKAKVKELRQKYKSLTKTELVEMAIVAKIPKSKANKLKKDELIELIIEEEVE